MERYEDELSPEKLEEINANLQAQLEEAGIDEKEVIAQAHENLNTWNGYFNENNIKAREDLKFALGKQWTEAERGQLGLYFKPAMVFNKLYDPIKKIVGEQRKNKPDLMVRSINGTASQEQIDLRTDLVRTLSYKSQNDLVYQQAFRSALMSGYGAYEICVDYESPLSFRREIKFELIQDICQTSFDPLAKMPHKGDGNFCAINYIYTKEEFHSLYPWVKNPVSSTTDSELLDFSWGTKETIVVSKYTQKHWFPVTIYRLSNGMTVDEEQWKKMQKEFSFQKELAKDSIVVGDLILNEIPKIVEKRTSQDYKIRQYFMTQNKIIQFMDWPSKHLPVIFVDGDSHYVQGIQQTRSFIEGAKDAQKFVNFLASETTADIKNRRREQWMATSDNVVGNEEMWRNPEIQQGALIAKPDPKTNQMPIRLPASEISQSLLTQYQRGSQDIREILGFSEHAELGGRDISGKARRERKIEGSMSAYVYFDNLNQAIEQGGRLVMDLLPTIIGDDEYPLIVTKGDGSTKPIVLNKKENEEIKNKLDKGNYDVEIDTGPSFAVQKEIALEFFQQTIAANPKAFDLIADLWAKNLDVQYMPQIAERFKTLVPAKILAKEEDKPMPPSKPSPMEKMADLKMQSEQIKMQKEKQEMMERPIELKIRQEQHNLEKLKILMQAREVQERTESSKRTDAIDLFKSQRSYDSEMARMVADLEKEN